MKLDQKYFVPFLAVLAIVTALLITFFTMSSQQGQREAFRQAIIQRDTLGTEQMQLWERADSLSVASFSGKYVVLDFWATWSNFSEDVHGELNNLAANNPQQIEIIAAVVQDQPDKVSAYIQRHDFPFHFVEGTEVFNKYSVPGMPTDIVFNPEGQIIDVFFGYPDSTHFARLQSLITDE